MNSKTRWLVFLTTGIVLSVLSCSYVGLRHSMLLVRGGLAEEQIDVFFQMRDRALQSTPSEAAAFLKYAHYYYPSGMKQVPGSALDLMVERVREEMVRQIVDDLRTKTGKDLGPEPQPWIDEYARE